MATLAQFRTRVSAKIGLDNTSGSAEQQLMDSWINEGVVEVLLALKCYVVEANMTVVAGQADYTLDAAILDMQNIFVTDTSTQSWSMQRVAPDEILYMRRVTVATSAPPRYYAVNGANMLMLYPTPQESDTITAYYVPRPTALSNPTDDPSSATAGGVPSEYHKAIELWALAEAGDYADDASSQNGASYFAKYQLKIKDYRKRIHQKGGNRLPRAVPAFLSRTSIPPRNDIDIPNWQL